MSTLSKKLPLCASPYNTVHIDYHGENTNIVDFSPCCWWRNKQKPYTIGDHHTTVESYLKDPQLLKVQEDFLTDTQLPDNCQYCRDYESAGLPSNRQNTLKGGVFNRNLRYININFLDNQCNMGCYMCEPTASTFFGHEYVKLGWLDKVPRVNNSDSLLEMLKPLDGDLVINVLGGEPLISKHFADLMEIVLEKNWSISITSNGSVINTRAVELVTQAKHSKIILSMDGINEYYPVMRYPFTWDNFHNNLNFYKNNLSEVSINFTTQVLNVNNLVDTLNYCRTTKVPIKVSTVRSRPWLSWDILTDQEVHDVTTSLLDSINDLKFKNIDYNVVLGMINDIKNRTFNREARRQFVDKMSKIWSLRGINPETIKFMMPWAPELHKELING